MIANPSLIVALATNILVLAALIALRVKMYQVNKEAIRQVQHASEIPIVKPSHSS